MGSVSLHERVQRSTQLQEKLKGGNFWGREERFGSIEGVDGRGGGAAQGGEREGGQARADQSYGETASRVPWQLRGGLDDGATQPYSQEEEVFDPLELAFLPWPTTKGRSGSQREDDSSTSTSPCRS